MQKMENVQRLIEELAMKENNLGGHSKDIQIILVFFHCLSVLSRGVCQLYTHGNDFLLILAY